MIVSVWLPICLLVVIKTIAGFEKTDGSPGVSRHPDRGQKAQAILQWLMQDDIITRELSDCTLGEEGYAVSAGAADQRTTSPLSISQNRF